MIWAEPLMMERMLLKSWAMPAAIGAEGRHFLAMDQLAAGELKLAGAVGDFPSRLPRSCGAGADGG